MLVPIATLRQALESIGFVQELRAPLPLEAEESYHFALSVDPVETITVICDGNGMVDPSFVHTDLQAIDYPLSGQLEDSLNDLLGQES